MLDVRETMLTTLPQFDFLNDREIRFVDENSALRCPTWDVAECLSAAAGRDAQYALVKRTSYRETATLVPQGPGTDLIYDVTGEFLQGKARPFVCDLSLRERLYAILPFQLESIFLQVDAAPRTDGRLAYRVEFREGSGERIRGVLPFQVQLLRPEEKPLEGWVSTDRDGTFCGSLPPAEGKMPGESRLIVRSQVNGQSAAQPLPS